MSLQLERSHGVLIAGTGLGAMTEWADIVKLVAGRYELVKMGTPIRPAAAKKQKSFLEEAADAMADSNLANVSHFGLA